MLPWKNLNSLNVFWHSGRLFAFSQKPSLTPPLKAIFFHAPQSHQPTKLVEGVNFWARRSIFLIPSPYASHGRTVLQFPTNSYHLSMVELAPKGVLCTHLGSKGSLIH